LETAIGAAIAGNVNNTTPAKPSIENAKLSFLIMSTLPVILHSLISVLRADDALFAPCGLDLDQVRLPQMRHTVGMEVRILHAAFTRPPTAA
jgi:hypothetical protein